MTRSGPIPRRSIDQLLDEVDALHSYPLVVQQILSVTRDEDFDIRRVVDCIERDPAIAASIVRLVNSSHFGLTDKVSSIQRAVTYLGQRTLRLAVLSFGLVDRLMKATPAVLFEDYWRRALTVACAARLCVKGCDEDDDTAYSAGLFADLGVLVFVQAEPSEYPAIYSKVAHGPGLVDAERAAFGFDHPAVTARLLSRWEFPDDVVRAATNHESYSPSRTTLDQAVYVASRLAEALWNPGIWKPDSTELSNLQRVIRDEFQFDVDDLISLALECKTQFRESAELFRVKVKGDIDANALRREAERLYRDAALDAVIDLDSLDDIMGTMMNDTGYQ